MQEDEFEKQVQMKMDQLAFDPSDTVWANVDRSVNKDKNRRKPLFWLFILAVPIVAGGGYIYFANSQPGIPITIEPAAVAASSLPKQAAAVPAPIAGLKKNSLADKSKPVSDQPSDGKRKSRDGSSSTADELNTKSDGNRSGQSNSLNTESKGVTRESGSVQEEKPSPYAETMHVEDKSKTENKGVAKEAEPDSVSNAESAKAQVKKSSSWGFGFSGIVGVADVNQELHSQTNSNVYFSNPGTGITGTGNVVYNSTVNSGLAFSLGGYVSKAISPRFSLSAGLNYHYYSTKINIGDAAGTSGNIYYSPVQINSSGYTVNTGSRSYTNQYHFVELPVLADVKLTKSKKLPIIWEAGFSFSYLISTDAMYYDPSANVYYKNMQLFNRVQWNAETAVLIGFNMRSNQLLLGPQLQYGISGLRKNAATGQQHLLSYGLKLSFVPHKK